MISFRLIPVILALVFGVLANSFVLNANASSSVISSTTFPQSTSVYLIYSGIAVSDTVSVLLNNVAPTTTTTFESQTFWYWPEKVEGTYVIQGSSVFTVTTHDLYFGQNFTAADGVTVTANSETWGRTGVVVFEEKDGKVLYTLAGYGYNANFPAGSLWWNYSTGEWELSQHWGFYTAVLVPAPGSEPTPEPGYQLYLPMVMAPSACLQDELHKSIKWQVAAGLGVCSDSKPAAYQGISPEASDNEHFNWLYPGVITGWLEVGEVYTDGVLKITATSGPVGIVALGKLVDLVAPDSSTYPVYGYAVYGLGYATELFEWGDAMYFYKGDGEFSTTPNWSDYTLLGIVDR